MHRAFNVCINPVTPRSFPSSHHTPSDQQLRSQCPQFLFSTPINAIEMHNFANSGIPILRNQYFVVARTPFGLIIIQFTLPIPPLSGPNHS